MRIRPSTSFGVLGVIAGLIATAAIAGGSHSRVQATACGCRPIVRHHRVHARWTHVRHVVRRTAVVERSEHDWSEAHGWQSARVEAWGWSERPWATDQFGFLTWPGKSHFVDGHWVQGAVPPPPPPPPEGDMRGPPPPGDMQGPPPPPGAEESYRIYRF